MRRKKHNPVKRYETQARLAVTGLCFGVKPYQPTDDVDCFDLKTGIKVPVGPSIAWALSECHFNFAFLLLVVSAESNGKYRFITDYDRVAAKYKHSTLVDYLNSNHDAIIDEEKRRGNKIVGVGWLACPVPKYDDDYIIERMRSILTGGLNA